MKKIFKLIIKNISLSAIIFFSLSISGNPIPKDNAFNSNLSKFSKEVAMEMERFFTRYEDLGKKINPDSFHNKIGYVVSVPVLFGSTIFSQTHFTHFKLSFPLNFEFAGSINFAIIPPVAWAYVIFVLGMIYFLRKNKKLLELSLPVYHKLRMARPIAEHFFDNWEKTSREAGQNPSPYLIGKFRKELGELYLKVFN